MAGEEGVAGLAALALERDARLEPADSLYLQGATILADGSPRWVPPRFAGIGSGGAVAVTTSRTEIRPGVAWIFLEYRWVPSGEGLVTEGRATLVLTRQPGQPAWRIAHAHSSSARP